MIYNRTMNGSVSEVKDIDKHAKKYTDMTSGSSSDMRVREKKKKVIVKKLARVKIVKGRLQVTD